MSRFTFVVILLSVGICSSAFSYVCNFTGVKSIKTPLVKESASSQSFLYYYQVIGTIVPDRPVIIYLPGGPGSTSMNNYDIPEIKKRMIERKGLEPSIPWIFFDPRTSGCNADDEGAIPDNTLTTWNLASDVIAVINDLKLKKYIIFGHSYGSMWGTVVASRASHGEVEYPPTAVVLSGVLGRGESDGSFSVASQGKARWDWVKNQLSSKVLDVLKLETPLGIDSSVWNIFITQELYQGYHFNKDGQFSFVLLDTLKNLASEDQNQISKIKELINDLPSVPEGSVSDFSSRLFNKVDCHEFSPNDKEMAFDKGNIIVDPQDTSCDNESFDRPFDSAAYQIDAPIYYFSGTYDIAAPYEGALYHFHNQRNQNKNFVSISGGGHLMLGQLFPDCKDKIWQAILNTETLKDTLPACKVPATLMTN